MSPPDTRTGCGLVDTLLLSGMLRADVLAELRLGTGMFLSCLLSRGRGAWSIPPCFYPWIGKETGRALECFKLEGVVKLMGTLRNVWMFER